MKIQDFALGLGDTGTDRQHVAGDAVSGLARHDSGRPWLVQAEVTAARAPYLAATSTLATPSAKPLDVFDAAIVKPAAPSPIAAFLATPAAPGPLASFLRSLAKQVTPSPLSRWLKTFAHSSGEAITDQSESQR